MHDYKLRTYERHADLRKKLAGTIKQQLEANGIIEERIVQAVIEKFTRVIKGPDGGSSQQLPRLEYLMNSHRANHERPPVLTASIVELRDQLQAVAKVFGIEGDLDLDSGHMFSYRVQVMFPTHFAQQNMLLTFTLYDTSKVNDYLAIERIAKNID